METIERAALQLGLESPGKRFLFGAALGTATVWILQPRAMFLEGRTRPFAAWSYAERGGLPPTQTPWWLAPLSTGVAMGVFL